MERWIDAHCHLADSRYSEPVLEDVIFRSRASQVHGWVQGGVCPSDWSRQIELRNRYGPGVITSFGLHPWWVAQSSNQEVEEGLALLERQIDQAQALGELGIDLMPRFQNQEALQRQTMAFGAQLDLGKKANKPLILHIVRGHTEALQLLRQKGPFPSGGIIHAFSGSWEVAQEYLSMGFYISVGGAITKKGYRALKRAVVQIPRDKVVIETDSPDQMPVLPRISSHALPDTKPDTLNEPANLLGIAQVLAGYIQGDSREILSSSTRNLMQLFGISSGP